MPAMKREPWANLLSTPEDFCCDHQTGTSERGEEEEEKLKKTTTIIIITLRNPLADGGGRFRKGLSVEQAAVCAWRAPLYIPYRHDYAQPSADVEGCNLTLGNKLTSFLFNDGIHGSMTDAIYQQYATHLQQTLHLYILIHQLLQRQRQRSAQGFSNAN